MFFFLRLPCGPSLLPAGAVASDLVATGAVATISGTLREHPARTTATIDIAIARTIDRTLCEACAAERLNVVVPLPTDGAQPF